MLHLYEKIKYVIVTANASFRKNKHLGFNVWRENCHHIKNASNKLEVMATKTLPKLLLRNYYAIWRKKSILMDRMSTAYVLMSQF